MHPVVAAIISSSVAVLVAVGSAVRADLQRATDRRYERRRAFLVDAQDAALALRDALLEFGAAARTGTSTDALAEARPRDADGERTARDRRLARRGRARWPQALAAWRVLASTALVDPLESSQADEERAFTDLNRAVGVALRSTRGTVAARSGRR